MKKKMVLPSCGFEFIENKKDGGGTKLCIWIIRDILGERLKKRWGCLNCGFEISKKWKGKREKKRWVLLSCVFEM